MSPIEPRTQPIAPETERRKRPYSAPSIAWSEETEIRANLVAACGKLSGTECNTFGGISS